MREYILRLATVVDAPAISAIYNHYVVHSTCTYQLDPETVEERLEWLSARTEKHPVLVAESAGGVVGWASLSEHKSRCAYAHTMESSVYVHHDWHRKGIGRALIADLIVRARDLGHHTILAGVSADQTASIALHEAFGFVKVAHYREVGYKFDRWLDVIYYQFML
ncbi:MAG: yncA [Chthonomonadaceae bacterium]|nr:yncA [Chthonomonadaceae bacterium]